MAGRSLRDEHYYLSPILILEDLNLSDTRIKGSFRLHIYPFVIDEIDGVPVIVVVEKE